MRWEWVIKGLFGALVLSAGCVGAIIPFTTQRASSSPYVVPSGPYAKFAPYSTVVSSSTGARYALLPKPVWDSSYGYGTSSPYADTASTVTDDDDDNDSVSTIDGSESFDSGFQQKGRNNVAFLESKYSSLTPNDFATHKVVQELIEQFEHHAITTQVRFVFLWQHFIADFVKNDAWRLGDAFKRQVFKNTDDLTAKLKEENWKVVDDVKSRIITPAVSMAGVSYSGKKVAVARAIWGIYNDQLYEAFVKDKLAVDSFFNIWRSYIGLHLMKDDYLDQAVYVLNAEILPTRELSLAGYMLVDKLIKDLQEIIEQKSRLQDSPEDDLGEHEITVSENSIGAASVEDLQTKLDELSSIKDRYLEVISVADVTPLRDQEIIAFVKEIDALAGNIEKGLEDFSSTKQFSVSSVYLLIAKLEELLLRAGPIVISKKALADWTKDIIKRTFALLPVVFKNKDLIQGAAGGTAAFFACAQFIGFLECLAVDNSSIKDLLSDSRDACAQLKKQYGIWSAVALKKPKVGARDFACVQPLELNVYEKAPATYDDQLPILVTCFPFISTGVAADGALYSADAARKVTQKGKGVRVYNDEQKDQGDRFADDVAGQIANASWYKPFIDFDAVYFRLDESGNSESPEAAVKKEAEPFSLRGIDEKTVDAFAVDLKANISFWIDSRNIDFKSEQPWMSFVTFGIVCSWLKTLATLDDIRLLSRDDKFKQEVSAYWGNILAIIEGLVKQSQGVKIQELGDADAERFNQTIMFGCAQYVVQILNIISETKIIDVLPLERKALASTLYKECSLRSKDDPRFSLDVRRANVESLVGRIEAALRSSEVSYVMSGVATLKALFDPARAIVADDLLGSGGAGSKVLLIDVICAMKLQERIFSIIQDIPQDDFERFNVQVLNAWSSFLDVLFTNQQLPFFILLKTDTNWTLKVGPKKLLDIHSKIKAYLASVGGVNDIKVDVLPFEIKSIDDLKIKNADRSKRFAAIFRDRDLKKMVVDAELVLASQVANPFVYGFDARFIRSKTHKNVSEAQRWYQLGAYAGTNKRKKGAEVGFDKSFEPMLVLRSMINLLESDAFKRGELGYALSEHLLVPVYYIAVRFLGDISNPATLIGRMYCAVVSALQGRLLDKNSMLSHAVYALSMCSKKPAKDSADSKDSKDSLPSLKVAKEEFDKAYPKYADILTGPVPTTNPIPLEKSKDPLDAPGIAVAYNDNSTMLVG